MNKPTLGPWYQHQETIQGADGTCVAGLYGGSEKINANAALIAACPDMLASLREIVTACEAVTIGTDAVAEPLAIALSAIAKAEGKQ